MGGALKMRSPGACDSSSRDPPAPLARRKTVPTFWHRLLDPSWLVGAKTRPTLILLYDPIERLALKANGNCINVDTIR